MDLPLSLILELTALAALTVLLYIVWDRIYCRSCKRPSRWYEVRYFTSDSGVEHVSEVMACRSCGSTRLLSCEPVKE
jgi:RNase P subunit RPR2